MKSRLLYPLLLCMTLTAQAENLTVTLKGVSNDNGDVRVSLYREPGSFRKEAEAAAIKTIPAMAGDVSVRFDDLSPGIYAVMAYHDEDANGEMKRRFGMFPLEGYGLSNDPEVLGPPAFKDSAFEVLPNTDTQIEIDIRY